MLPPAEPRGCYCQCHREPDLEPVLYGVALSDDVGRLTACSVCANAHWKVYYLATEPVPPAPTPKAPAAWVDPPRSQADGWHGD